ncbi:MAG: hypothetical protein V3S11_03950, partial [Elusimicrobiota bacterium]
VHACDPIVLPSQIRAVSQSEIDVVSQVVKKQQHPAARTVGRWAKLKKATAGLWKPSAGAASAYELGRSIQGFLTGTRSRSDSGEVPFAGGLFGKSLRPEFRLSPALHNKKLKPLGEAPPAPKKKIQHQTRRTVAPVENSGGFNPLVWALKPIVDFFRLALLQEAHRPSVLSAVLAAAVLAPIPYVGFVAVHELGHYLAARFLGVPAGTVRYYAMDGIRTDDGRFIVRGYVVTARWEKPWKLYWVTLTGPIFGWLYYLAALAAAPFAYASAQTFFEAIGLTPASFLATSLAVWLVLIVLAGFRLALTGHSGDFLAVNRAWRQITSSRRRSVELDPWFQERIAPLSRRYRWSTSDVLRESFRILNDMIEAQDPDGKVTVLAGDKAFHFPLQSEQGWWYEEGGLNAMSGSSAEVLASETILEVELYLSRGEAQSLKRAQRKLGLSWPEPVFWGSVALLEKLTEWREEHGELQLLVNGKPEPILLP